MTEQEIKEKERELGIRFNKTEREFLLSDDEKWAYEKGKKYKKTIRDIVRQVKFMEMKDEIWTIWAGKGWSGITDEMRVQRWNELKDEECIYFAGRDWSEITDKMRKERWSELKDEQCIYLAGKNWSGITDEMRRERWSELKDEEWTYYAGNNWDGITNAIRQEKWHQLKDEGWIYHAGKDWNGITDEMRSERFKELKNLEYVLRALNDWKGIDTSDILKKILTSEVKEDSNYYLSNNSKTKIYDFFKATKDQVLEKLLNGEINHKSFMDNYPFIREKILLVPGIKKEDLSEFDYFYQNLSMSYGLLK